MSLPTTRRLGRTLLCLLTLALSPRPAAAQQQAQPGPNDAWIGKRVITQRGTALTGDGKVVDDADRTRNLARGDEPSTHRVYKVTRAENGRVWIVEENGSARGWVEPGSLVPVEQAVDFYTDLIRANPDTAANYISRGNAWLDRKEYDKAIADHDDAIRVDPANVYAYLARSNAWTCRGDYAKALADCTSAISKDDWKSEQSVYATIIGVLAARRDGKNDVAKAMLDAADQKADKSSSPYPVVKYLRGEIDAKALTALATDVEKETVVRCYLGLDQAARGEIASARENLLWVKDRGTATFLNIPLAIAELDRLDTAKPAAR